MPPVARPRASDREDPSSREAVGERIRVLRITQRLSQRALGVRVGVSGACVSHWEHGIRAMYVPELQKLAAALGTTALYLLTGGSPAAIHH
jgi:transcriptional regulator with XRE-family HTH domain